MWYARDKEQLLLNILSSGLCQDEVFAMTQCQAVALKVIH